MHPPSGRENRAWQRIHVGRKQLAERTVFEDSVDQWVLVAQILQHLLIDRKAGLRAFAGRQLQLIEENRSELLRGIDVERLPRQLIDFRLNLFRPLSNLRAELG